MGVGLNPGWLDAVEPGLAGVCGMPDGPGAVPAVQGAIDGAGDKKIVVHSHVAYLTDGRHALPAEAGSAGGQGEDEEEHGEDDTPPRTPEPRPCIHRLLGALGTGAPADLASLVSWTTNIRQSSDPNPGGTKHLCIGPPTLAYSTWLVLLGVRCV